MTDQIAPSCHPAGDSPQDIEVRKIAVGLEKDFGAMASIGNLREVVPVKRVLVGPHRDEPQQLADPGLELLDELTECAILGPKADVA
ncbi:hypothetical protein [Kribbella swartbergensis]